ncbi:PHP domain-containing protein [Candidatus Poribacteria bacterium]|nr:PHP domain-containing protein [Candidatus Poribacteria bacterium]
MTEGYKAYRGVIHVHSDRSGGACVADILDAARKTGLDFVIVTDQGPEAGAIREQEGWHDGVLLMAGEEVYTPQGHFLAFETREPIGIVESLEVGIEEVRRQVGLVVGTHYHFGCLKLPDTFPHPIPVENVDLIEIWSFLDEFLATVKGAQALQNQVRPERMLNGPPRCVARRWDQEQLKRPIAAIGSLNAHYRKEPLLEWREFFPYHVSFRTIQTVAICPPLPDVGIRARDMIWAALRQGSSFLCNHALGDCDGFSVSYEDADGTLHRMGETAEYTPGGYIRIQLPEEAEFVLRKDSLPLYWGGGESIRFPAPAPGIYRVEAYRDRRVWLFSNAIRVLGGETSGKNPSTVSDFT